MKQPQYRTFLRDHDIDPDRLSESLKEAIALYQKGEQRMASHGKTEGKCLKDLLLGWDKEILTQLSKAFPPQTQPKGNDAIVAKLYNQGRRTGILRSELHSLGFRSDWKQKKIATENHLLERSSMFSFTFSLKKI